MHNDSFGILYVEPSAYTSHQPVIDELTRKMAAALRVAEKVNATRGFHMCACGAISSNCDHRLPDGTLTNSLAAHYLAWHRGDISEKQLNKVRALDFEPVEPTDAELAAP